MSDTVLGRLLRFFGGGELDPQEKQELVKEALLMTLARASSADIDLAPVEVDKVREIIKKVTGAEVSQADVRVAAHSELFETAPLTQYLSRLSGKLDPQDRAMIAQSLAEVIRSDRQITFREVEFFDKAAHALRVSPSELMGLFSDLG